MSLKEQIINEIIRVEGGYKNDPSDSGGETNYGITAAIARDHGYRESIVLMPRRVAFEIYAKKYWHSVCGDELEKLSPVIAEEVVDTAVNTGPSRAGGFLQRALNALNNRQKLYADITVDGHIGPATILALQSYLTKRDEKILHKLLNCLQGEFYISLVEKREKDEKFIYGWLKNRVTI